MPVLVWLAVLLELVNNKLQFCKWGAGLFYNSPTGDLNAGIKREENAGGRVLQPKTLISDDVGYMAILIDSEGNRIALHSRN